MLTAYERRLILSYLSNVSSRLNRRCPEARNLVKWVEAHSDLLGLANFARKHLKDRTSTFRSDKKVSSEEWRHLRNILDRKISMAKRVRGDRTRHRVQRLGRGVGLSRTDIAIFEFLLRYSTQPHVESMVGAIFSDGDYGISRRDDFVINGLALPSFLGLSIDGMWHSRLVADAPLIRTGLVSIGDDGEIRLMERLKRLATAPGDASLDVHRLLFGASAPSELEWADFDHVAKDRDHVEGLLRGALRTGATGVNILVYGPPGAGKTEFCKTLAQRLEVKLYSIGETDEDGDEPLRGERLQELRFAQRTLDGSRDAILLFDEMEDLLSGRSSADIGFFSPYHRGRLEADGSKVFLNRLLEQSKSPTLWTTNSARQTCPTVLRRMMFALELRQPSPRVRARIWTRQLARQGIELGEAEAHALAREYEVSPGVAAGATAAARLVGGNLAAVRRGVRSLSRILSGEKPPQRAPEKFDPALIRADLDLEGLAERLAGSGAGRFSLCLQGPPGTGKSAFVRYLADRVGLEVVQKRASDLMSMWVGATERQIADAFAEARDAEHFLVFDEADSLLADRRFAQRSWEVSQVNEMLTWMESHPLPFACTTNFSERFDPATLRRFDFKVTLDYLTPDQSLAAFRAIFSLTPPAEVAELPCLTPGDFALVRRKAEILDSLEDPRALTAMLHAECEAKPYQPKKIGFQS
ncbi:MAG: AAA family ATPase [Halieaceae bacterium]|nr:AAA family ATPase [Halieaceae bacterium]